MRDRWRRKRGESRPAEGNRRWWWWWCTFGDKQEAPRATCQPCACPTLARAQLVLRFEGTRNCALARRTPRPKVSPRTFFTRSSIGPSCHPSPGGPEVRSPLPGPVPTRSCKFPLTGTKRTPPISSVGVCVTGRTDPKPSGMSRNGHFRRWVRIPTTTRAGSVSGRGCFGAVIQRPGVASSQ